MNSQNERGKNTGTQTGGDSYSDGDLNRALAEAITQGSFDPTEQAAPEEYAAAGKNRPMFHWRTSATGKAATKAVNGLDISPTRLSLIEISNIGKQPTVVGILVHDFNEPDDWSSIEEILRSYGAPSGIKAHVSISSPRAVVRRFNLPMIAKKQREAAACWEARKLIPFPISDTESLHGFQFEQDSTSGWKVTLAAIPKDDIGATLDCIQALGWQLESVSIAGTRKLLCATGDAPKPAGAIATLLWSPQRSSFVVFGANDLGFHYDLGNIPPPDEIIDPSNASATLSRWLGGLEKATAEAVSFYGGSSPRGPIELIQVFGLPEAVAPLITDWQERFGAPVAIAPTLSTLPETLPDDVREWFAEHGATLIPAYIATAGTATIDLTPATFQRKMQFHKLERIMRTALAVSIAAIAAWSGMLWASKTMTTRTQTQLAQEIQTLESSPLNAQIQASAAGLQRVTALLKSMESGGTEWMPHVRRTLATLPSHARLMSLSLIPDAYAIETAAPIIRMEGLLHHARRAHSLTYSDWLRELESIFGKGHVALESTRTIEWKQQIKSGFVISVRPGTPRPEATKP